jgi:chlorobactene glucosyltransferase
LRLTRLLFVYLLTISIVWSASVLWLILRAFNQRGALPPLPTSVSSLNDAPSIAVIVPARDEAENIGPCLTSLIAQDYPADRLEILVVDDESSDATPAIVRRFMEAHARVELIAAPRLPPGWKGKVNACCAGTRAARADADWLCFLDADMRATPLLLRSAVAAAQRRELDLLSLSPRQELQSFAERLIIPCGLYALSFSQDLSRFQSADSKDAAVTGQFMLIRRDAYQRVGGFASVCGSVVEDLEFARLLKRSGGRVLMQDGSRLLSTRMYSGWQTLWPGFAKNLIELMRGPYTLAAAALVALAMAWAAVLLPVLDLSACAGDSHAGCIASIPALIGAAAAFGFHIAGAVYFRIPVAYGLIFPLGYTAGALIALDSLRWRLTGFVRWKGRVYR